MSQKDDKSADKDKPKGMRKAWWSLIIAIATMFLFETAFQVRYALTNEEGPFFRFIDNEMVYLKEELDLALLFPENIYEYQNRVVVSNSDGLRSPEIPVEKEKDEIRVAVIGASTIMGYSSEVNEETIPYRLEEYLQEEFKDNKISVINAGINGFSLRDQRTVYQEILKPYDIDLIVWYTGLIDLSFYCEDGNNASGNAAEDYRLFGFDTPKWVFTTELLNANTRFVRKVAAKPDTPPLNPDELDRSNFRSGLVDMYEVAKADGIPLLSVTNTRAFRPHQPQEEQDARASFAKEIAGCFDTAGLNQAFDDHNKIIVEVGEEYGTKVFKLDEIMPEGDQYFTDSIHFTKEGNDMVARWFKERIVEGKLLQNAVSMANENNTANQNKTAGGAQ